MMAQLITLTLPDPELEEDINEQMGKNLFSMDRQSIKTGKPIFLSSRLERGRPWRS